MTTFTLPDTEAGVVAWLKTVTTLVQDARISTAPQANTADGSIQVQRVGGGDDTSGAPLDRALIQIDCWSGSTPSRTSAAAIKNEVRAALKELNGATAASTYLYGAEVIADIYAPDTDFDPPKPRYSLTAQINARSS